MQKVNFKNILRSVKHLGQYIHIKVRLIFHRIRFGQCIFFIATPIHGNLGDQAIVFAQYRFFEALGKQRRVFEITRWQYQATRQWLQHDIKEDDIIVIDGGGNVGTLWIDEENKMRDIIKRFPKNPIFIFPQTAYFNEDKNGKQELENTCNLYALHKHLTLFARDKGTFELFQTYCPELKCYYTPDMVPFINDAEFPMQRQGILLCMRNDTEKVLSSAQLHELKLKLSKKKYILSETETVIKQLITHKSREKKLRKKWLEFSSAQLVITDRLHGMIFAAITGTPCIAFDNISHKVRDSYEWIKYLSYVRYCTTVDDALLLVDELIAFNNQHYDAGPLQAYYKIIKEEVSHEIN
jgi:pyruvyl transferase EpsI